MGTWLRNAGYHTSFHGKYVNSCEGHVPHGWSHWGGFVNTYDFYNASHYDMDWKDGQTRLAGSLIDALNTACLDRWWLDVRGTWVLGDTEVRSLGLAGLLGRWVSSAWLIDVPRLGVWLAV